MKEIQPVDKKKVPIHVRLWEGFLKPMRMAQVKHKTFVGRYADIAIERMKWASDQGDNIIIIREQWVKHHPMRKVHKQRVYYVDRNAWTALLGWGKRNPKENLILR